MLDPRDVPVPKQPVIEVFCIDGQAKAPDWLAIGSDLQDLQDFLYIYRRSCSPCNPRRVTPSEELGHQILQILQVLSQRAPLASAVAGPLWSRSLRQYASYSGSKQRKMTDSPLRRTER